MTIIMPQQGWQCPNCGSIISPHMMWCPFCSGEKKITYTTTTTAPPAMGSDDILTKTYRKNEPTEREVE